VGVHHPLCAAYFARVSDGDEDVIRLAQGAEALERQEFRVTGAHADPDQAPVHAFTRALVVAVDNSRLGISGVAAQ
jgi:hypothetical protein